MVDPRLVVCVNERLGCGRKSCAASGSRHLIEIIKNKMAQRGIAFPVIEQMCLGRCEEGINMRIAPGGEFFTQVLEKDIESIILALVACSADYP